MDILKYISSTIFSGILNWIKWMKEGKDKWTTIRTVYDPLEAQMIKDILESGGIDVIIRSSKVTPYPVNIGRMGEIKVLIRDTDLEDAELVLEKLSNDEDL